MALVRYDKPYMFDRQPSIIGSGFTRLNVWLMFLFRPFPALEGLRKPPGQLPEQSAMHESRRGAS
jgi:hypothetical protein